MKTFETDSPDERCDAEIADAAAQEYLRRGGVSDYAAAETLAMLRDRLRAFEDATRELSEHFPCDECNCAVLKVSIDKLGALLVAK